MNWAEKQSDCIALLRDAIQSELARFDRSASTEWNRVCIGFGDEDDVVVMPCRLLLPFHYPSTIEDLDAVKPAHFDFPADWDPRLFHIPLFREQYDEVSQHDTDIGFMSAFARTLQKRIELARDACRRTSGDVTFFGIERESDEWWEVLTFHLSGPPLPSAPMPRSDVQLYCRLKRQTHAGIGRYSFGIENGVVTELSLDGASTTDKTVSLMLAVPNLSELCCHLQRLSLKNSLVSRDSIVLLRRALPNVQIEHSYFQD